MTVVGAMREDGKALAAARSSPLNPTNTNDLNLLANRYNLRLLLILFSFLNWVG